MTRLRELSRSIEAVLGLVLPAMSYATGRCWWSTEA